jgi:flagellar basal body-associated protein FliL
MKKSSLILILAVAATALTAAPALAKTSLSKGKQLCEAAAKAQTPAPKSVRTENDATRVSDATLTFTLRVKAADDSQGIVTCKVDRETNGTTLAVVQ